MTKSGGKMKQRKIKVRIGVADYLLLFVNDLKHGEQDVYGLAHRGKKIKRLEVDDQLQPGVELLTTLHEFFHGAIEEYGIEVPEEKEEAIVDGLALALTQSIMHSKEFREYLGGKYRG